MKVLENLLSWLSMFIVVAAALIYINATFSLVEFKSEELGGTSISPITLVGSSSYLVKIPKIFVSSNATNTDATYEGGTVKQSINTTESDNVLVCITAKGGTATSTFAIRQYGSFDNTNFYIVSPTSTNSIGLIAPTTTVSLETNTIISFDPGTGTTTPKCFPVDTYGYNFTRFEFWGEDVDTDPNDGVRAYIQAVLLGKY